MSAIFGFLHSDDSPADSGHLRRMSEALAAHGEETGGHFTEGSVGLGHRLQRFTPRDVYEHQPIRSADGRLALVADARLDNRPELLRELRSAAASGGSRPGIPVTSPPDSGEAATTPDSRLLLSAFETWGPACVERLAGVYAFAAWDGESRTLFLARSPIVAPALLFAETAGGFAFASTPGALHALPHVPRALNGERLAGFAPPRENEATGSTLYCGISRLATGSWLQAGPGGVRAEVFWRPDLRRTIRFTRDEEYVEAFLELFGRVVEDCLDSLTPVAIELSGGLDSSSVAAVAAPRLARRGQRLSAFTEVPREGFDGPVPRGKYPNETEFVRAIADWHPNLDLHLLRTEGQHFLTGLDETFDHLEQPFRNSANRVWIEAIFRAARDGGRRVVLDGMQGNLTMSWTGAGRLAELLRAGRLGEAIRQSRAMARRGSGPSAARSLVGQGLLPLLPVWLRELLHSTPRPEGRFGADTSIFHPDFRREIGSNVHLWKRPHPGRPARREDPRRIRRDALAGQDVGVYVTAYRAMFGVDTRSPAADARLAEFCLALPEEQFLREGEPRSLVRRAMAGRLPACVLENHRRGLQAADWFERLVAARVEVAACLQRMERSALARRVLDLGRLREALDRLPEVPGGSKRDHREFYRILQQGVMLGRFLCWFEAGGRP